MYTNETNAVAPVFASASLLASTGFGYRLASLRTQRRISSWDLAAALRIPRLQLDRIERGDEYVDQDLLEVVAQIFRMPVQKLLLGL